MLAYVFTLYAPIFGVLCHMFWPFGAKNTMLFDTKWNHTIACFWNFFFFETSRHLRVLSVFPQIALNTPTTQNTWTKTQLVSWHLYKPPHPTSIDGTHNSSHLCILAGFAAGHKPLATMDLRSSRKLVTWKHGSWCIILNLTIQCNSPFLILTWVNQLMWPQGTQSWVLPILWAGFPYETYHATQIHLAVERNSQGWNVSICIDLFWTSEPGIHKNYATWILQNTHLQILGYPMLAFPDIFKQKTETNPWTTTAVLFIRNSLLHKCGHLVIHRGHFQPA